MRSRKLANVYVIQRRSTDLDDHGQRVETWTDMETFRGGVHNRYSREFNRYNIQESRTDAVITCRRLACTPTPMDRVRSECGTRYYNIVAVPDPGATMDETILAVQEQPYHAT